MSRELDRIRELQLDNQKLSQPIKIPLTTPTPTTNLQEIPMDGQILKSGAKKDDGKLRFDLFPSDALEEIAFVYTIGAKKYADRNWEHGIKWGRVFAAMMRHAWAFWGGETFDRECLNPDCVDPTTGKHTYMQYEAAKLRDLSCHICKTGGRRQHHLASVAWGAITLLAYNMRELTGFDDRGQRD